MSAFPRIAAAGRWAAFAVYLGFTVFLSSQPSPPGTESFPDYLLHILEFAALTLLLLRACSGRVLGPHSTRALSGSLIFGVSYGIVDEIHQWFVPGRHSSVKDAVVDAGATLATVGAVAWLTRRSPAASSRDPQRAIRAGADPTDRLAVGAATLDAPLHAVPSSDLSTGTILLTRQGCHLCTDSEGVLIEVLGPEGRAWSRIDVDSDPVLAERYGLDVPVLFMEGIKRFKGKIERERLVRLVAGKGRLRRGVRIS